MQKRTVGAILGALCLCLLFSSCVNYHNMVYLQEDKPIAEDQVYQDLTQYENLPLRDYKVKTNDNLIIRINTFDGNTQKFLNEEFSGGGGLNGGGNVVNAGIYLSSYTVSKTGTIQLPLLGEISVRNKTTQEIKAELDKLLEPHIRFPSSSVKLANFRVTVLGEVNNPGLHYIYNDYGTLMEALGLAGDLTAYADRKRIKIIRETENGPMTVNLNLTQAGIISSPYYYLRPNDVIYIEPVKAWAARTNANTASIIISAVSVVTLIANVIVNTRNP